LRRISRADAHGSIAGPCATRATWRASARAKRIEQAFAWVKTIAGQDQTRFRGTARAGWAFTLAAAAYNLIRLPKLLTAPS
jgi:Transposase DDE domain